MNGSELKILRQKRNISQAKLSVVSGIVQAKLSGFELGKFEIGSEDIALIKKVLADLDHDDILKMNKKRYRKDQETESSIDMRKRRKVKKTPRNPEYLATLRKLESDANKTHGKRPKAVSFFAGCGGLCYGMKAAGFDIVAVNELDEAFRKVYAANFKNFDFLPHDIREISGAQLKALLTKHHHIDIMIGGPPCQGFSLAGKRDIHDARNTLFENYLSVAKILRPKVILMENVRLLTSMKDSDGKFVSKRVLETFEKLGYKSDFFELNAKDYGVPQHRERVFFVGIRKDLNIAPSMPRPDFASKGIHAKSLKPYFSFGDAVSDLEFLESAEESKTDPYHKAVKHPEHVIRWLIDVPEGKSAHDNADPNLRPPSGYNTTYKRQVWLEPAGTVATTYSMISGCRNVHPIATRSLTTREALRLQSFPDSFKLNGNQGVMRTTIGNAVPPMLSFKIGKHIMDAVFCKSKRSEG